MILGPVEIARPDTARWTSDLQAEVNYSARFTDRRTGDEIRAEFFALTNFEKAMNESELARWTEKFFAGRRRASLLTRRVDDFILVFSLQPRSARNQKTFEELASSARVNHENSISPCFRLGMIENQVRRLAEARDFQLGRYTASLRRELLGGPCRNPHCSRAANHLLEYLNRIQHDSNLVA